MFITAGAILLLACSFEQINKINEYSSQYFLDHTIINGVNCSNMTLTEAKETLTERWNGHNFKIMKNGETPWRDTGSQSDLCYRSAAETGDERAAV